MLLLGSLLSFALAGPLPHTTWESTPVVRVCTGSPFTVPHVREALHRWHRNGAPHLEVEDLERPCSSDDLDVPGQVLLDSRLPVGPPGYWSMSDALAMSYFDNEDASTPRTWMVIHFDTDEPATLLHELGHIWLDHSTDPGDVMYPYTTGPQQTSLTGGRLTFLALDPVEARKHVNCALRDAAPEPPDPEPAPERPPPAFDPDPEPTLANTLDVALRRRHPVGSR